MPLTTDQVKQFVYYYVKQEPCLVVPLNLEATMRLNHGRAFVGFTAGTGKDTWQVRHSDDDHIRPCKARMSFILRPLFQEPGQNTGIPGHV